MSRIEHFKKLKERYLDQHTIHIGPFRAYDNQPGVSYFDLVKDLRRPKHYMLTYCFKPDDKQKAKLIRAAWLPYADDETMVIDLGDRAYDDVEYFFTADLSGCRLEIGCEARPKVAHIPARLGGCEFATLGASKVAMSEQAIAEYDRKLDAEADKALGQVPRRKYSKRSGYTTAVNVTVVGYRKPARWEFYGQEQHPGTGGNVTRTIVRQITMGGGT
jgi:hypothetical protein